MNTHITTTYMLILLHLYIQQVLHWFKVNYKSGRIYLNIAIYI